jgi:hypothetical protein
VTREFQEFSVFRRSALLFHVISSCYTYVHIYSTFDDIKVKGNVTNSSVRVTNTAAVIKVISKCSSLRRVQNVV